MIQFKQALSAWGAPEFHDILKYEIQILDAGLLPLQQALSSSSHVTDRAFEAMILDIGEDAACIRVKAGIFYTGVVAGCSCADDPTPLAEQNEYCVVQFCIDKRSAETTVALLPE